MLMILMISWRSRGYNSIVIFKETEWTTTNFLMINERTVDEPDRDCDCDCDCRSGSGKGFCPHFWGDFMKSVKSGFFNLEEWTLTPLPDKIHRYISNLKI